MLTWPYAQLAHAQAMPSTRESKVITMSAYSQASESKEVHRKTLRRVAVSSFLGNFIEWFDYATYTYFAITIGIVFFPEDSGIDTTLLAFAIFAISFLLRPLGALFWGSLGDKKGRKWALSTSIFLMTGACFLIGCLPSYAQIGFFAPLLLLIFRTAQGFSAAGEYSGAAVFLAEYAPMEKRGTYCSLVPVSTAAGLLAGSTLALVMKSMLSPEDIIAWGWRVPFLLAAPLGLIAHYIRTKLEDAPAYRKIAESIEDKRESPNPVRLIFTKYPRRLFVSIAATMVNSIGFYLVLTYLPVYLTSYVHMHPATAQLATDIALLVYIGFVIVSGRLSDRFGRRAMMRAACVAFTLLAIPAFMMLNTGDFMIVMAAELMLCASLTLNDGSIACYQAEMFPTEVRYTGAALGSNIAYAIFGGTASFVATALIDATGNPMAPAFYMIGISVVVFIIFTLAHEYSRSPMDAIE